jgi:hypothetical protein
MNLAFAQIIMCIAIQIERINMKKRLFAGVLAGAVLGAVLGTVATAPAEASCRDSGHCAFLSSEPGKRGHRAGHRAPAKHVARRHGETKALAARHIRHRGGAAGAASIAVRGNVISMITAMAPAQGVPAWFALRIAKVESNYNPAKRGAAGEYGVFQIKCATARGIGFDGNCAALADARTNVQWGIRHLALAIRSSNGNLRLAASKHNGGLGRRTQIASYVNKVF